MRHLAVALALLVASGSVAAAACPEQSGNAGFDALAKELAAAPTCQAALDHLHECAWGSSADTQFGAIVVKTCEAAFVARLPPTGQSIYAKRMRMCGDEYAHQDGTMYRSAAALCRADVAAAFAADPALAQKPIRASFDCGVAKTVLEQAICADDALGEADIILAKAYKATLKGEDAKARSALVEDQRRWHAALAGTCKLDAKAPASRAAVACLTRAFEARFTKLDACQDDPDCASGAPP